MNSDKQKPRKVFISHASDDKEKFVIPFATKLRESGLDTWVDMWEILAGDSLVKKIFDEGLKEADTVIIVLSNNSVNKPWVREELDVAVVARISRGVRLIPIIIDDCEIPEALSAVSHIRVKDTSNFDEPLRKTLDAIFGYSRKPTIGEPPAYTKEQNFVVSGLSNIDSVVLREAAKFDLENNIESSFELKNILPKLYEVGLVKDQILESIDFLNSKGHMKANSYPGGDPDSFGYSIRVTSYGFEEYCCAEINDYQQIKKRCAGLIINENIESNFALVERTQQPLRLVSHILYTFETEDLIETIRYDSGKIAIYAQVSLKRELL